MKLMQRLKMLPRGEYSAFAAYLNNELFNKRADLITFFNYLRNTDARVLNPELTYQALQLNMAFSAKNWHLLCSRLLKALEEYFAHRQLQQSAVQRKMLLCDYYRDKNQARYFQKASKEANSLLEKSVFRSGNYWLQMHCQQESKYDYTESQNRTARTNLQEVSDSLDTFYMASKLKIACRQISRSIINSEVYDVHLLPAVIDEIQRRPELLNIPAIAMYYYCYQALAPQSREKDFATLRSAINSHAENFSPSDLRDIYFIAINFCIQKINRGQDAFNKEAFEFYRLSLQGGLLLEDGLFPESTFNNIVALAIKQTEYSWAEQFIEEYKNKLKPSLQSSVSAFCLGKILFAQGAFDECLSTLAQISTNVPFIYLGARTIQLKIFYENKSWDALDSLLDSLRVYIQRRKDLGYRKSNYQNLLAFTKKLLQLGVMNKKERNKFREEILRAEIFAEKDWFLGKVG